MEIKQLTEITPEVMAAFGRLIPQLAPGCLPPTAEEMEKIIYSGSTLIFIATGNGEIVGTLTLVVYRLMTGTKAWIEDVVVDTAMRGRGIGKLLTQHAIGYATGSGIAKIDLTSSPSRIEANALYQRIGFVKRETNVYRYEPGE